MYHTGFHLSLFSNCLARIFSIAGIRKERGGRAIRRERRKSSNEDRDKSYNELSSRVGLRTAQDKRKNSRGGVVSALCMPPDQVLVLLLGAEPPAVCSRQKHSPPYTEITMMSLLTNMADKELVHMTAWAKKVPGEIFQRSIKVALIVNCECSIKGNVFKCEGGTSEKVSPVTALPVFVTVAAVFNSTGGRDSNDEVTDTKIKSMGVITVICAAAQFDWPPAELSTPAGTLRETLYLMFRFLN